MSVEVEAKLDVPTGFVLPSFPGYATQEVSDVVLPAEYWDTADLDLLAWGATARFREGKWTVKVETEAFGKARAHRVEIDVPGDSARPPDRLLAVVRPFVSDRPLETVAVLTTERHRCRLGGPHDSVVEVALDDVRSLRTGRAGPTLHQVEVELLNGEEQAIDDIVRRLRDSGARPSSAPSKLAAVIGVDRVIPPAPVVSRRLRKKATVVELVSIAIERSIVQLMVNGAGALGDGNSDAVHQARVATRRLRSDLQTLSPLLTPHVVEWLRTELRWVGQSLGAVRDLHVLREAIEREGASIGMTDTTLAPVLAAVDRDTRRSLDALARDLGSDRYLELVKRLLSACQAPPLAGDAEGSSSARKQARRRARHAVRRVERATSQLGETPTDAQLHDVRRRAKRARYANELVAPLLGKPARETAEHFAKQQDALGAVQDAVAAIQWLTSTAHAGTSADEGFVLGRLAGRFDELRRQRRADWLTGH
jgi:CHAD domain-containing protein